MMIKNIVARYWKCYFRCLLSVLCAVLVFFGAVTLQNLRTAAILETSARTTGTYDAFVQTDSSGQLPSGLADQVKVLSRIQTLYTEPGQPSVSLWNDFSPVAVEVTEGVLPSREGEVSVGLNTALINGYHPGSIIPADQYPLNKELTVTGIHNESGVYLDGLLVFQENLNQVSDRSSSVVFFTEITDPALLESIHSQSGQTGAAVQLSSFGTSRWRQPDAFSRFIQTVSLVCLVSITLLLILSSRIFLRIIRPETDVLRRIGLSEKVIRRWEGLLLLGIPAALCLLFSLLLSACELWLWRGLGIENWMSVSHASFLSVFLQIVIPSLLCLLLSNAVIFGKEVFGRRKKAAGKRTEGQKLSHKKKPASFALRRLLLTGADAAMMLFLMLLFLCVPFVAVQAGDVLAVNEYPLLRLQDRDMRLDLFFENRDAGEIQTLFDQASEWSAGPGRAGVLELTGAVQLQSSGAAANGQAAENMQISASLTIPLNEELFKELAGSQKPDTEIVCTLKPEEKLLGTLSISRAGYEYGTASVTELAPDKTELSQDENYTMILMNPDAFHPEEISSSYGNVLLSISWFFSPEKSEQQELEEAQALISAWKPSSSRIYLQQNIRLEQSRYRWQVLWITVLSLLIIGLSLTGGAVLLYRQKLTALAPEIRNVRRLGLSQRRVHREIRKTLCQQLAVSMVPSLCTGLIFGLWKGSWLWLTVFAVTRALASVFLLLQPLPRLAEQNGQRKEVKE